METIESNKLIAEFMGDFELVEEFRPEPDIDVTYCWKKLNNKSFGYDTADWRDYSTNTDYSDQVCYHFKWDWLMPVVEKISSLNNFTHEREWRNMLKETDIQTAFMWNDIDMVYGVVVEFITWYNEV